jgi:hypothetical protein
MSETAEGTAAAFADALAGLKRRGSMILLVSKGQAAGGACRRLSGGAEHRTLSVRTDSEPPSAGSPDGETIVYRAETRSAAATIGVDGPDEVIEGDLGALRSAVESHLRRLASDDPDPATVRLCVDSADTLLGAHDERDVFRFIHSLGGAVREVRGMAHVHLPGNVDDDHVQFLTPLFDALVEVRADGRERWNLRDPELSTDWLSL